MTDGATFNLIDEPWISVRLSSGASKEMSLTALFHNWTEIRELSGELPTTKFAIQRFLLAILYRAAAQKRKAVAGDDAWTDLWNDPEGFSRSVVEYLEHWRVRFDLRHPEFPFFQVAGLHSAKNEVFSLERLVLDSPLGGLFTTRTARGLSRISWSEAARWLIHAQAFDTSGIKTGADGDPRVKGGKGYPIGVAWTGQIGGIALTGNNLFESLMLNLVPVQSNSLGVYLRSSGIEVDLPPWERDPLGPEPREGEIADEKTDCLLPSGPVDLYTWQSRRVRLVGDSDGVTGIVLAQGDRMMGKVAYSHEAMTAWQYSEYYSKQDGAATYTPRKHSSSRSFWRSLPSVIPQLEKENLRKSVDRKSEVPAGRSPAIMQWLHYLVNIGTIGYRQLVPLEIVGVEYGSNDSVVANVVADTLTIPAAIISDNGDTARFNLNRALGQAEEVGKHIGFFAKNLAMAGHLPSGDSARDNIRALFYSRAEHEFHEWISDPRLDRDQARRDWEFRIYRIADDLARELVDNAPEKAVAGYKQDEGNRMDLGTAEVQFRSLIRKQLPLVFSPASSQTSQETSNGKEGDRA